MRATILLLFALLCSATAQAQVDQILDQLYSRIEASEGYPGPLDTAILEAGAHTASVSEHLDAFILAQEPGWQEAVRYNRGLYEILTALRTSVDLREIGVALDDPESERMIDAVIAGNLAGVAVMVAMLDADVKQRFVKDGDASDLAPALQGLLGVAPLIQRVIDESGGGLDADE